MIVSCTSWKQINILSWWQGAGIQTPVSCPQFLLFLFLSSVLLSSRSPRGLRFRARCTITGGKRRDCSQSKLTKVPKTMSLNLIFCFQFFSKFSKGRLWKSLKILHSKIIIKIKIIKILEQNCQNSDIWFHGLVCTYTRIFEEEHRDPDGKNYRQTGCWSNL